MNSTTPAAPPGTDNTSGTITDAKTMLNQIQKLLDDGKTTEARNLFRQFNQQYPGYPVDPGMLKQFQTGTNN
jgi:outer membrane protein assembly factor BamD (BamD/ComL family)